MHTEGVTRLNEFVSKVVLCLDNLRSGGNEEALDT
jgi:hypothetical protein